MGEVYRARDATLKRDVAIKVLPEYWSRDPERLLRFEHEAQTTAALNHPNIVSIFHVGQYDGSPYIVTELLQGETLRDRLRRGPMRLREVLDYGIELARGLAAAHDAGIVHRDLKPENTWMTKDGRIKILDFGLAKFDLAKTASADGTTLSGQQSSPGCGRSHCQRQQAVGPTLSQPADSQGATPGFANCSHPAVCNTVAGPGANFMHPGHAERPVFPTLQERGWTVLLDPVWPSRFGVCSGDLDHRGSRQR